MKPMIKYAGGKTGEIEIIKKFIPEYSGKYIEPFLGGGALYFSLEPEKAVINDINSRLMEFYQGISNDYDRIKNELSALETVYIKNRQEYEEDKKKANGKVAEELSEKFKKLEAKALMVIGKTPLIEKLYKDYIVFEYDKKYSVNIKNRFDTAAKHLIITNYNINFAKNLTDK